MLIIDLIVMIIKYLIILVLVINNCLCNIFDYYKEYIYIYKWINQRNINKYNIYNII